MDGVPLEVVGRVGRIRTDEVIVSRVQYEAKSCWSPVEYNATACDVCCMNIGGRSSLGH